MRKVREKIGKLSYKYIIGLCVLALIGIMMIGFSAYTFYNYVEECQEIAGREANNTAELLINQIDERLDNLKQYYISFASREDFKWLLEEELQYSDYSPYMAAAEIMSGNKIFMDYIESYLFVNFRTGWAVGSGGMFPLEELDGAEELYGLLQRNSESVDKNYWLYHEGYKTEIVKNWQHRLIRTSDGLSLVMRMPVLSVEPYSVFIVNIDMDIWEEWVAQCLSSYEDVVVLDRYGDVIYDTDERLVEACKNLQQQGGAGGSPRKIGLSGGADYMVSSRSSSVLGWEYYACYDINKGQLEIQRFSGMLLLLLLIFVTAALFMTSYAIYRPFGRLLFHVSDKEQKVAGNELEFLAGRFTDMKNDKQALEAMIDRQRERLLELFELRMLNGEIRFDEEWGEYLESLHLKPRKYFSTAVIVLNLQEGFGEQSEVGEDVLCLGLIEELPDELGKLTWLPVVYNACAIFCLFGEEDEALLLERIMKFYEGIQELAEAKYGCRVLMGVSATHTEYRHVRAAYKESINALTMDSAEEKSAQDGAGTDREECRFFLSNTSVRVNTYNNVYEKEIRNSVKAMDKEQCYKVIDEFSEYLRKVDSQDEVVVYIIRMVNVIHLTAITTKLDIVKLYPDGIRKIYYEIIAITEPSRVRRYMKSLLIDPILHARNQLLKDNSQYMLREIERRIEDSRGNITLSECAEDLGVHPTYIWKVLKAERGKSFLDYLEAYKLEEAKRLLRETDMTVAEIATELNYTNAQNFIRFFSKGTGVTPGRFRKLS